MRRLFDPETTAGHAALLGSRYAYSFYLVHYSIFSVGHTSFMAAPDKTVLAACLWLLAVTIVSCVAAVTLYHCIEKPCMDARRYFTLAPFSRAASPNTRAGE